MQHADVLDCLSANNRIKFFGMLGDDGFTYKGNRISVGQAVDLYLDEEGEVRGTECMECGGESFCHHMDEDMKAQEAYDIYYELAEAEATGN